MAIKRHVELLKSKVTNNGAAKLPSPDQLHLGEIAINYAQGVETLSIKNESGNVVTFPSIFEKGSGTYAAQQRGGSNEATGANSVAIGTNSHATGEQSFAQGNAVTASTYQAHAEGYNTRANGYHSHAEGQGTRANSTNSHAEGRDAYTYGEAAHAEGYGTRTNNKAEHASGHYNVSSSASTTFGDSGNTLFSVGIGTSDSDRKNAFEIRQNGDIYINNGVNLKTLINSKADTSALGSMAYQNTNNYYTIDQLTGQTGASVARAESARTADKATSASTADKATSASTADKATSASTAYKATSASTAATANSVSWSNVTGKPTIPSVYNGKLQISIDNQNEETIFSANQSNDHTLNLVPKSGVQMQYSENDGLMIGGRTIYVDGNIDYQQFDYDSEINFEGHGSVTLTPRNNTLEIGAKHREILVEGQNVFDQGSINLLGGGLVTLSANGNDLEISGKHREILVEGQDFFGQDGFNIEGHGSVSLSVTGNTLQIYGSGGGGSSDMRQININGSTFISSSSSTALNLINGNFTTVSSGSSAGQVKVNVSTGTSSNTVAVGNHTHSGYAPTSHNQASNTITAMTSYSKASTASAISTSDSLNTAIGKLEKAVEQLQEQMIVISAALNDLNVRVRGLEAI